MSRIAGAAETSLIEAVRALLAEIARAKEAKSAVRW
jgi:hypothetical protein